MYSVIVKSDKDYKDYANNLSLANALLAAEDAIIHIVGYLEGHGHDNDIFLQSQPSSTVRTPEYYCMATSSNTFKIYRHQKIQYVFSSAHIHKKLYTVKIVRTSDKAANTYDCVYHHRVGTWNADYIEVLEELMNDEDSFFGSSLDSSD